MSRIGGAIRDTMSIENDASHVNVWERGRPSFQLLLNARDPTPGHSYLRLLRRKAILLRLHAPRLVNAILTNICSIVTHTIPRPAEPGRIVRVCPG